MSTQPSTKRGHTWKIRSQVKSFVVSTQIAGIRKSSIGPESEYALPYLAEDVKAWIEEINPGNKTSPLAWPRLGCNGEFQNCKLVPTLGHFDCYVSYSVSCQPPFVGFIVVCP